MYNTLKEIKESLSNKDLSKYTNQMIGKTADEIIEMFRLDNIEISKEFAEKCANYFKETNDISDEELENVAGGGCGTPDPKYHEGQRLRYFFEINLGGQPYRCFTVKKVGEYNSDENSYLYTIKYDDSDKEREKFLDNENNIQVILAQ